MGTAKAKKVVKKVATRKSSGKVLLLRTVAKDWKSYGGFLWPHKLGAVVEAPDWDREPECGHGLHGLRHGEGDSERLDWSKGAHWLVIEADARDVVDIKDGGAKAKCRKCTIVHIGDQKTATQYLLEHGGYGRAIVGLIAACGHNEHIVGGDRCHLTGGNDATVTGGDNATVTGGYGAKGTGGDRAMVTGGNDATVTGGNDATVTGGDNATVTGGDRATVTGGDCAKVTGGNHATVTGGNDAQLRCEWYDGKRYRTAVAYVGEGVEAGVTYKVEGGEFVKV